MKVPNYFNDVLILSSFFILCHTLVANAFINQNNNVHHTSKHVKKLVRLQFQHSHGYMKYGPKNNIDGRQSQVTNNEKNKIELGSSLLFLSKQTSNNEPTQENDSVSDDDDGDDEKNTDTIRVRIWRALAPGDELSLKQLGSIVGERQLGDLKHHLTHVEKQAKTLRNKSNEWRERRGLVRYDRKIQKLSLITRRGKKNTVYVRLG